jgi:hypothetical protein
MRTLLGAVTVFGMLLLSGCGGGTPIPTLPPTPSATPIFASEEEALAAAEEAYAAYQAAVDLALQTLSENALDEVAVDPALQSAKDAIDSLRNSGSHQVGETRVASVSPTDLSPLLEGGDRGESQIYACLDLTSVGIQAPDGSISRSEIPLFPMLVTLVLDGGQLRVSHEEVWDGTNFCA